MPKSKSNPAKRLGLKEVEVNFGTFDFTVTCVIGSDKGLQEYVRWKLEDQGITLNDPARGRYFLRQGYAPVMWIPRAPRSPREYGTLAHEMLHIVRVIMDWVGMPPLNHDTEEAYCHALGHGVTKILEAARA